MNHDSFSISRFWRFFLFDLKRGILRNGPSLLICLGVYLLIWLFLSTIEKMVVPVTDREKIIAVLFFISVTLAPSIIYGYVNDLKKGVVYTMLPVRISEKYLSMLLVCLIFWPVVCILLLVGLDALLTSVGGAQWGYAGYLSFGGTDGSSSSEGLALLMLIFSIFICGNLIFRKKKYGLTIIFFIALVILWGQLKNMLPLTEDIQTVLIYVGIIFMIAAGYFRLKTLKY